MPGFVLAGLALAGSPGPATLSLAATGAVFGARRGLAYMSGIVLGMVAVMGLILTGLLGVVLTLPGAMPAITAAAAAYFVHLAWRIATAPPLANGAGEGRQPSFAGGMLLSLVNPKGYAAVTALFSGFVLVRDRFDLDAAAKVVVAVAITAAVNTAWLFAGAALTRFLRQPRSSRIVNVGFAVLLILSVAFAMLV